MASKSFKPIVEITSSSGYMADDNTHHSRLHIGQKKPFLDSPSSAKQESKKFKVQEMEDEDEDYEPTAMLGMVSEFQKETGNAGQHRRPENSFLQHSMQSFVTEEVPLKSKNAEISKLVLGTPGAKSFLSVTKPTLDVTAPNLNVTKPTLDVTKPTLDITAPNLDISKPCLDFTKPNLDITGSGVLDVSKPSLDVTKPFQGEFLSMKSLIWTNQNNPKIRSKHS